MPAPRAYRPAAVRCTASRPHLWEKWIFDIVAAVPPFCALPLLVAVAIAIKVHRGPVLFFQYRYGYRTVFKIYKFRSMRSDVCDPRGMKQTVLGDPGLRRSGKILRKTASMKFRSLSMSSRAICRWSDLARMFGNACADLPYEDLVPYYFQDIPRAWNHRSCAGERLQSSTIEPKSRHLADRL